MQYILYNIKKNSYAPKRKNKKQCANLVSENDVSQTKVYQEKWKYEWSKKEICHTKKPKETNPGNFAVIRN
jgi:hypothetical protein